MREHWEHYLRNTQKEQIAIQLNTTIYLDVEDIEIRYPNLVIVKLKLKEPDKTGLLQQNEDTDIVAVESTLEALLHQSDNGVYVGRIISSGHVHFIYYFKSIPTLLDFISASEQKIQNYEITSIHEEDPTWNYYQKILYPTSKEWQIIENHHVCDTLIAEGDDLEIPRVIEHKLQFISEYKKRDLIEELEEEGFQINDELRTEDGYSGFSFERSDKPTHENIDALTLHLIDMLDIYDAKYDGWVTSLVSD